MCLALLEEFDGLDESDKTFFPLSILESLGDLNMLLEEQGWR